MVIKVVVVERRGRKAGFHCTNLAAYFVKSLDNVWHVHITPF